MRGGRRVGGVLEGNQRASSNMLLHIPRVSFVLMHNSCLTFYTLP